MKIYASRIKFNDMSDYEILDYLLGKDLWIETKGIANSTIYYHIREKNPNQPHSYKYDFYIVGSDYIYKHITYGTIKNAIIRPVELLTTEEINELQRSCK